MNETDMELQAIRQKLQNLKSEAVPASPASPWLPPRQTSVSTHLAEVTAAIESLKQHRTAAASPAPLAPTPGTPTPVAPLPQLPSPPDSEWIGQVLQQCESHIARVNDFGQQQGMALLQLKQYLDQIELEFEHRGWDTPAEVDAAIQFLMDQDGFGIPLIERSQRGQLQLHYHTVDVYQAEHEAMTTAQALRQSQQDYGSYAPATGQDDYGDELGPIVGLGGLDILQQTAERAWQWCQAQLGQTGSPTRRSKRQTPFTPMDALIWFSGAAIVRALLNVVFQVYRPLWAPMVLLLLGVGAIALHRTLNSRHRPTGLVYRLFVMVAGFVIGGHFG